MLVGTSGVTGAFTEEVIRSHARATASGRSSCRCRTRPCSPSRPRRTCSRGPTARRWSRPAARSSPVEYNGTTYRIGQANNALMFPGLGLGVIVCRAATMPPSLFIAAARALAKLADPSDPAKGLLPDIARLREVSATVAVDVINTATAAGIARVQVERPDRGGPRSHVAARLPPDRALTRDARDTRQEHEHGADGGGDPGRPDGRGRDPEGLRHRRRLGEPDRRRAASAREPTSSSSTSATRRRGPSPPAPTPRSRAVRPPSSDRPDRAACTCSTASTTASATRRRSSRSPPTSPAPRSAAATSRRPTPRQIFSGCTNYVALIDHVGRPDAADLRARPAGRHPGARRRHDHPARRRRGAGGRATRCSATRSSPTGR